MSFQPPLPVGPPIPPPPTLPPPPPQPPPPLPPEEDHSKSSSLGIMAVVIGTWDGNYGTFYSVT